MLIIKKNSKTISNLLINGPFIQTDYTKTYKFNIYINNVYSFGDEHGLVYYTRSKNEEYLNDEANDKVSSGNEVFNDGEFINNQKYTNVLNDKKIFNDGEFINDKNICESKLNASCIKNAEDNSEVEETNGKDIGYKTSNDKDTVNTENINDKIINSEFNYNKDATLIKVPFELDIPQKSYKIYFTQFIFNNKPFLISDTQTFKNTEYTFVIFPNTDSYPYVLNYLMRRFDVVYSLFEEFSEEKYIKCICEVCL